MIAPKATPRTGYSARTFSPAKAKVAATHIVNMWLQMRLDFIDSMGEDMDE
ncbi:hypothetical protein QNH14_14160 [Apirhabdus apintestini]|nr:hypothetical protein QNH14_14160 [Enterobacteriaceae bacterium CA-0114]